jgi:type IV secretion system protein VirD4
VNNALSVYTTGTVRQVTNGKSDWQPSAMRDRPMTVYFRISPSQIASLRPLLRLVFGVHLRQWMPPGSAAAKPGKVPVVCMLDEFPQLGNLAAVETAIHVGRAYGVRCWMLAQQRDQLSAIYGAERARAIINACAVHSYVNPVGEDARKLAEEFGDKRDLLTGEKEPFIEPADLTGPSMRDFALVKVTGERPMRFRKRFLPPKS